MKMFKKAAALMMAAVLAVGVLTGCSGSGSSNRNYEVEQKVIESINATRKNQNTGLEALDNDADLQAKAMKILDACAAKQIQTRPFGTAYVLTKAELQQILGENVAINYSMSSNTTSLPAGLYIETNNYYNVAND